MDTKVQRLFICLVFRFVLFNALETMFRDEGDIAIWQWQELCALTFMMVAKRAQGRRPRRLWAHGRGLNRPGFFDQNLLVSFNTREFKGRMRMDVSSFEFLCTNLAPQLHRQNTNMRTAIPVQIKVAVSVSRLATGNSMQSIADLYKIGLSTAQVAVRQFCSAVKTILLRKFIQWPSIAVMAKYAEDFEGLHGIPYVVGAVDGSHIPVVAPRLHAADYYNRKGFYSVLLQGVVTSKCIFWVFDIGWAGSMHDANLWTRLDIEKFCEAGKLTPYALMGDAAYPCRP
jgi:hypothetical protein